MTGAPPSAGLMRYAARFADVPRALQMLRHHPGGLTLSRLASSLGVPERQLREELTTFFLADVADHEFGVRQSSIEFVGPDGDVTDAVDATVVRLVTHDPLSELGVELLDPQDLGLLYRAAWEVAQTEPGNEVLRRAVARLGETLVPTAGDRPVTGSATAAALRSAIRDHRRVAIVYARTWAPGVIRRVVQPYRVTSTRRGYELDGASAHRPWDLRTFLVSGIRELQVLEEPFEPPEGIDVVIAQHRRTTAVQLVVPADRMWAIERFSERVEHRDRDEDDVEIVAHVVPPVEERVGLMVTVAGAGAFVISPTDLADADSRTARRLLRHHRLLGAGRPAPVEPGPAEGLS